MVISDSRFVRGFLMDNSIQLLDSDPSRSYKRRPNRRERRCAETRERIINAALELFSERGVAATTVEDITNAADVGKGTFFNYFPSKEHILAHLCQTQWYDPGVRCTGASLLGANGQGSVRACSHQDGKVPAFAGIGAEHSGSVLLE